ncbi:glutathione S-transferase family protein [Aureimonas populi]|uniref:Glutathione S-transferase family protein n=1 Tax=Aureimonas populi TaxID=1701758 RepID=A0ABW5CFV2_9HYPH|nr:glutathione S-transferase N-terminal domain-containing protein [Aureimonas populi]
MIELFTWTTPNGEKPIIMLEECGLDYDLHLIDISAGEQKKSDFLAINPNGKIPALVDDGIRVFESGAILIYLAEKSGRFLAPSGKARAEALAWTFFQAGGTGPMLGQWYHFEKAVPEKIPYAVERYREESIRLLSVLDGRLGDRDYLAGEFSIADIMNYSWAVAGLDGLDVRERFPALSMWAGRMGGREALARGLDRLRSAKGGLRA